MHLIKKLFSNLIAVLSVLLLIVSTSIFFIPILIIGLLKLIPIMSWRVLCTRLIDKAVCAWVSVNGFYVDYLRRTKLHITGDVKLDKNHWYLVIANHQSWLDIVLLQRLFNHKIPMLKFFIKDQLKWVPLLGFAWWAMGLPFMKRYSRAYLEKNPHKRGQDLNATRKALYLFQHTPSTIMNFIEGTRFTEEKKNEQQSPYKHLLKPRAGGISFVIEALNHRINSFLDVTIIYPHKAHSLWDYLCGRINEVTIHVREIIIPPAFLERDKDKSTQEEFYRWLNDQWVEKDLLIEQSTLAMKKL